MKTQFSSITKPITGLIVSILLFGGWFSWDTGPAVPSQGTQLYEKQAHWSRFLGYGPETYASQLSAFVHEKSLMIAQQARKICAIQADNGHVTWQQTLDHYSFTNAAAINATHVFIATNEPRLFALDINTGEIAWSVILPHMTHAKVGADQHQVYVKTITGEVLALHAKNGKQLWRYQAAPHPSVMLETSSSPQLTQDQLWVGFPNGKLLILNRTHGQLIKEHTVAQSKMGTEFDQLIDIAADPILDTVNAVVYVSAYHGMLKCLSLAGDLKWERPFSGYSSLALGKHVYGLDDNHIIYAFNKENGEIVWKQETFKDHRATAPDYQTVGLALTEDKKQLILGDQLGNIYWVSTKDGAIEGKASFKIASPILNMPLTHKNKVYAINRRSQWPAGKTLLHHLSDPCFGGTVHP